MDIRDLTDLELTELSAAIAFVPKLRRLSHAIQEEMESRFPLDKIDDKVIDKQIDVILRRIRTLESEVRRLYGKKGS